MCAMMYVRMCNHLLSTLHGTIDVVKDVLLAYFAMQARLANDG